MFSKSQELLLPLLHSHFSLPPSLPPFLLFLPSFSSSSSVGEKAQDDGWLTGTSELHLQLHSSEGHPIRLDILPSGEQYSVRIQAINYCAKTVSEISFVTMRIL